MFKIYSMRQKNEIVLFYGTLKQNYSKMLEKEIYTK